ncbi:MAG: TRAP transporter small permease [Desulfarculaceae bacterium]
MARLGRILDLLANGFAFISGLMVIFALLAVSIDVVMRYFFNSPIPWVLQVSEYILLYVPFLAAAYVLRSESHIKVDILLNHLSPRLQALLNLIASILGFAVIGTVTYYGARVTWDAYERGLVTMEHVKMPQFIVYLAVPLGSVLFAAQFLRRARKYYLEMKGID